MRVTVVVALALIASVFAGCISGENEPGVEIAVDPALVALRAQLADVAFTTKMIIDDTRAGGEPVIAVTQAGSLLVSAHPGWTHYHPSEDPTHPGLELVTPVNAQSYLWKSTDNGDTWRHIGLPGFEEGPRSTGFGVSDPEFTVMADGTICYTDLEGLAMSSVSCSTDDGETWTGNPIASQRPNDRQWLASYGDELYFTANYFADHNIIVSTDRGLTWETRGNVPCSGDIIADPDTGTLYAGCGPGIAVSEDGGRTWDRKPAGGGRGHMTEPAIDSAGNVWMTWRGDDGHSLFVGGTPDAGETWPWKHDITPYFRTLSNHTGNGGGPGTYVWPWISAGSEGRVAVTWIGSYDEGSPADMDTDWHIFTAILANADSDANDTLLDVYHVSDAPIHHGPICQSGTACQVLSMTGNDAGDRRLGDFFETTIDFEGRLHIVVSDTLEAKDDVISHVAYFRQEAGLPLLVDGDRLPTQG